MISRTPHSQGVKTQMTHDTEAATVPSLVEGVVVAIGLQELPDVSAAVEELQKPQSLTSLNIVKLTL